MILDFIKNGKINKKLLLIENYKKLGLNENQYAIVSIVLDLDKAGIQISTPLKLSEYMNLSVEQIEKELSDMMSKHLMKFNVKEKTKHTLDFSPLFNKLAIIFQVKTLQEVFKTSPYEVIEQYFNDLLNNTQKNVVDEFLKVKQSPTQLIDILIGRKFKTANDFIKYLSAVLAEETVIEITEYDWLRNE